MAERTRGVPIPHLRAWRQAKYLSQLELGERAGLSRITITRAERGESIGFPNIRKLAAALGVTPDDLVHSDPPPYSGAAPAQPTQREAPEENDRESDRPGQPEDGSQRRD